MTKISQLPSIGANLAADDEFVIRDVSDGSTPNKKVTASGFIDYVINQGTGSGFTQIAAGAGPLAQVQTTFSGTTGTITFGTASAGTISERARIDSSGRLLVGNSSSFDLNAGIQSIGTSAYRFEGFRFGSDSGILVLGSSNGTQASPSVLTSPNLGLGIIQFRSYDGAAYRDGAWISSTAESQWSSGSCPTRLTISTTASGASTPTERVRIDSSGRVGIGTTAAHSRLYIQDSNTGEQLTIRSTSGNAGVAGLRFNIADSSVTTDQYSKGSILFVGDGIGSGRGSITFNINSANDATNVSTTNERLRIDGSGRLLVGTPSGNALFNAGTQNPRFQIEGTVGDGILASLTANRNDASGPTFYLAHSRGTAVGGTTVLQSGDQFGIIAFAGADGTDYATGASITAVVDGTPGSNIMPGRLIFSTTASGAASPTERARITSDGYLRLASGTGGIQFGGDTAAANALDDYEEGTFTPTIVGTTDAGTGTYTGQTGRYVKIGRQVLFELSLTWTAHTGTGNMEVGGLPFTSYNSGANTTPFSINSSNLTVPANSYPTSLITGNSTRIRLYSVTTGGSAIALLAIDTAASLWLSGHYEVA
jgi:hypothetical protein